MVSVVIATYNRRPLLAEAVASVVAQTYADWELYVVDDASSDDTWPWLSALGDKRIHPLRQPLNRERSAARNRGLAAARGDCIVFLDDDDRLLPGALQDLVDLLARYPRAVAAAGRRVKFRVGGYQYAIPHTAWTTCRHIWPEITAGWASGSGQNLFRTAAVRAVGGFSESVTYIEDRKMWLALSLTGPVALTPKSVLEYRDHGPSRIPVNIQELRRQVNQEFLDALPADQAPRGRRARAYGAAMEAAGESVLQHLEAFRISPSLAVSPLTGPYWIRGLGKAFLASIWRPPRLE